MNRASAKHLSESWILDAKTLLDAGRWHAAYYLLGYAVECGLKACVLAYIEDSGVIFQDKRFAEKCFTHEIEVLVKAANLEVPRGIDIQADPVLAANWQIVKDWNVEVRYKEQGEANAQRLFPAVTDELNGVLPWIKAHW